MMELKVGSLYRSRDGEVWCCWRLRGKGAPERAAVDCIRTLDGRVEYFFADGRYDEAGEREHTLVEEVTARGPETPERGKDCEHPALFCAAVILLRRLRRHRMNQIELRKLRVIV